MYVALRVNQLLTALSFDAWLLMLAVLFLQTA